jgi:excisionase family DNA binding protein
MAVANDCQLPDATRHTRRRRGGGRIAYAPDGSSTADPERDSATCGNCWPASSGVVRLARSGKILHDAPHCSDRSGRKVGKILPGLDTPKRATIGTTEAGKMLGITGETVRKWIASGALQGIKHGRNWLVYRDSDDRLQARSGKTEDVEGSNGQDSPNGAALRNKLDALEQDVRRMQEGLQALGTDRDRYRSDAASLRSSALRLHAAIQGALRELQTAQGEVLGSLLGPGTPDDIP